MVLERKASEPLAGNLEHRIEERRRDRRDRFLARALDLLYPPRCAACAAFGDNLCEDCMSGLVPASGPGRCPRCGVRIEDEGRCRDCGGWRDLDGARAACEMAGPARRVVHGLKFSGIRDLAAGMAEALRPVVDTLAPDAIFPIPLHRRRQLTRGFNQAEVLLDRLGVEPALGRLERVRATASQVGLSASERRQNVAGAFRYRGPAKVEFDPPQTKVWQDRRDGGNSPWSVGWNPPPVPDDGRWTVRATFSEPGTYVLRALASDGGLIDFDDVTVTVTR